MLVANIFVWLAAIGVGEKPSQCSPKTQSVLWMQTAAEFQASCLQAYALARFQLETALRDQSWTAALEQGKDFENLPPAVILDLDETVLDNSLYQGWLVTSGKEFTPESWDRWCVEGDPDLFPGAADFIRFAESKKVTVFYISNRTEERRTETAAELVRGGLSVEPMRLLLKGNSPGSSDKTQRRKQVADRYRVLLLIGDDFNDFVRPYPTVDGRKGQIEEFRERWGRRWIMLPNPSYGSWERALTAETESSDGSAHTDLTAKIRSWVPKAQTNGVATP
jgi:acid phosphatase